MYNQDLINSINSKNITIIDNTVQVDRSILIEFLKAKTGKDLAGSAEYYVFHNRNYVRSCHKSHFWADNKLRKVIFNTSQILDSPLVGNC